MSLQDNQDNNQEEAMNGDYIPHEEKETSNNKSYLEKMQDLNNSEFSVENVESVSKEDLGDVGENDSELSLEQIQKRYNDLIEQNNNISTTISENIKLEDMDEESADLVARTIQEIEDACNRKSFTEKAANTFLPAPVRRWADSKRKNVKVNLNKQRSVAELAQKHFDSLSHKRDNLTETLKNAYQIRDKLEVSKQQLGSMEQTLTQRIGRLQEKTQQIGNAAEARVEQLKTKELIVQVQSQYLTQKDLANQIDAVQYVAEQLVDSINAALPAIRSNFIDQVSITAGLKQMRDLKDNVDKTRRMTITLQERSFQDTKEIMEEISKDGLGYTEEDMKRIEKLNADKKNFQRELASGLSKAEKQKENQSKRLAKMIAENKSIFEMEGIEEKREK